MASSRSSRAAARTAGVGSGRSRFQRARVRRSAAESGFRAMARPSCSRARSSLCCSPVDLGERDIGAVLARVEPDRLPEVGVGVLPSLALEAHQAAIGQQGVAESAGRVATEGVAKIGLGGVEFGGGLRPSRGRRARLARCEAAEQVEPGQVGVGLEASGQVGLGLLGLRRPVVQVADRQQALGPEMVGLGPQGHLEMPPGLRQQAALVALQPAEEMVERPVRLNALGRRALPHRPLGVAGPLQEGGPPQVIGVGRLPAQFGRPVQDADGLAGLSLGRLPGPRLGRGFGQDHQHLVASQGDLITLLLRQRRG